jgi:hypothetical protein
MIIIKRINRITPGVIPEFPNGSPDLLWVSEEAAALTGVGVPVSVTSGKRRAMDGKGARVGVLLEETVPVRISVPGVKSKGEYVFSKAGAVVVGA